MTLQTDAKDLRNGGQILVQQLKIHGTKRVFMVAGESYLPCIDAFYDHQGVIDPIVCRQESGAVYMAEAYGKLTGEPGVCFVTRGPGATNASVGVHTAFQDSTPLILFVGQVGNDHIEREAFQEIDYRKMFGSMCKWVAQIDRTERIPEFVARAFAVATSGRPGPVVLALPEDTLWGRSNAPDLPRYVRTQISPSPHDISAMVSLIAHAKRPMMVLGGSGWTQESREQIGLFAQAFEIPVGVSWRRLECMDWDHPNFVGHVGWGMTHDLREQLSQADLIISVCAHLNEPTSEGYSWIESPMPRQRLIHIYPDPSELGRLYHPSLAITATPVGFAQALQGLSPSHAPGRGEWVKSCHKDYLNSLVPLDAPGTLNLNAVSAQVDALLPRDACVTVGAGNYALFPHRYRRFSGIGTSLAPVVGTMGYGLPAAISAKLESPERTVVCFAGDGCFQMTCQELGVAMQYRLGIVVLVFNNSMWGTIRAHQEREFPGRTIALGFENPDFSQLIQAYKGFGQTVTRTEDFTAAFKAALEFANTQKLPALIELQYDADGIAPGDTLTQIRARALGKVS
jgi:acetolactate synthase-1/2/3 large subunit